MKDRSRNGPFLCKSIVIVAAEAVINFIVYTVLSVGSPRSTPSSLSEFTAKMAAPVPAMSASFPKVIAPVI